MRTTKIIPTKELNTFCENIMGPQVQYYELNFLTLFRFSFYVSIVF